jgi:hypothetical protein
MAQTMSNQSLQKELSIRIHTFKTMIAVYGGQLRFLLHTDNHLRPITHQEKLAGRDGKT